MSEHFQQLLFLNGVPMSLVNKLSEPKKNGFHMELDLVINLLILKYFSELTEEDNLYLKKINT